MVNRDIFFLFNSIETYLINLIALQLLYQLKHKGVEWVVREGVRAGGRNEPSLVCTYE
jgi:hypothetical protein